MIVRLDSVTRLPFYSARIFALGFLFCAAGVSDYLLSVRPALAGSGTLVGSVADGTASSSVSVEARQRLHAHGRFLKHRVWGDIWRPDQDTKWRPFTIGRWARDTSGSLRWVSNEPFGDTVYRFGRWTFDDAHQWIWIPGSRTSPAWVTWRKGDKVVGWAPVAPVRPADARSHVKASAKKRAVRIPRRAWVFVPRDKLLATDLTSKIMPATWNKTLVAATTVGLPEAVTRGADQRVARQDKVPNWPDRSDLGGAAAGDNEWHQRAGSQSDSNRDSDWYEDDGQGSAREYADRDGIDDDRFVDRHDPWSGENRDMYSNERLGSVDEFDYADRHADDLFSDGELEFWRDERRMAPHDFRFRRGWRARARHLRHRAYERRCDRGRGLSAEFDDGYRDAREHVERRRWSGKDHVEHDQEQHPDYDVEAYYEDDEGYGRGGADRVRWRSARGVW